MKRYLTIPTVFLPVALLYLVGGLEFLERRWMDLQFRLSDRSAQSDIVVVDIDPKSLRKLEVWPWPRGYHATVLEELFTAGATRVGMDIDFASRSIEEEDKEFERVLATFGNRVVLPVLQQWQHDGPDSAQLVAVEPLPAFAEHAALGSINVQPGPDGLVRRYDNHGVVSDELVPAFASALAGYPQPDLDAFYIDFGISSQSIPRISYIDVLTGRFDPEMVRGRTVIVGATAVELGDQIAVPIAASLPGPLLQALAFESLTQGRALWRTGSIFTLFVTLLIVLLVGPRFEATSWRLGLALTAGSCLAVLVLGTTLQQFLPVILDAMPWVLTFVWLYVHALVTRIDRQAVGLLTQGRLIRNTESLMRHVVENSFDSIVTVSKDGAVETFNRSAQQMFGYSAAEASGRLLADLVQPDDTGRPGNLVTQATAAPVEAEGRTRSGRTFPVELVVTPIDMDEECKLVAVMRDITERKAHQEQLQYQATHDPLTKLPNRLLLRQRITRALKTASESGGTAAVMLLDLDRFKEINDALGHRTGDLLLKQVARRLQEPLDPGATIARLGGDEFAVLLPDTSLEQALQVSWKLIEALRSPFSVEGLSLQIETSLGLTLYPDHGHDAETLMQRADVAMYVAKRKRAGLAVYRPEQDFNSRRHLTLRGDLRRAIDGDLLTLVYQPKVLAQTDEVIGAEALLRWEHPQHGNIPPDEFVELAEHSGLIRQLTQWVLANAMRQISEWQNEGFHLNVSVNLSARNLLEEDLPHALARLLAAHETPPEQLTLEITESVIMEDPEQALKTVTRLENLGVGISIDDFGTGYSSLSYLMRLPAKEMKIDKSFVMKMGQDPASATIVHSTIDLAHNLGLAVVAEGVESPALWNVLKELGCDIGQGYHFSPPVPPEEVPAVLGRLAKKRRRSTAPVGVPHNQPSA